MPVLRKMPWGVAKAQHNPETSGVVVEKRTVPSSSIIAPSCSVSNAMFIWLRRWAK
jgi:hypothetical protein